MSQESINNSEVALNMGIYLLPPQLLEVPAEGASAPPLDEMLDESQPLLANARSQTFFGSRAGKCISSGALCTGGISLISGVVMVIVGTAAFSPENRLVALLGFGLAFGGFGVSLSAALCCSPRQQNG